MLIKYIVYPLQFSLACVVIIISAPFILLEILTGLWTEDDWQETKDLFKP